MLSTSDLDRDLAESYSLGANSYVCKPVTTDEFLEAARPLGVYWLGINKQARTETLTDAAHAAHPPARE